MVLSVKDRRHSGRVTPRLIRGGMKWKEVIDQGLEPSTHWDDWKDYRDGQRGSPDKKHLRTRFMRDAHYFDVTKWNAKLKKLISRRRARR